MNRPALGYGLAAVALSILALTWASFFAPIENTSFGITVLTPDGTNARITSVIPGSEAEKNGLRPGDLVDLHQLTLSQRYRLEVHASPIGTAIRVPIVRSGATHTVTLHAQALARPRDSGWVFGTLFNGTISLLIIALIVARQPSLATGMLVLYGAGAPQSLPFATLFTWIPDPLFGAVAALCQLIVAQLPLWSLLPFIVRFPREPDTPQARAMARAADTVFSLAVIVFSIQVIYEPVLFISWGIFDTASTYAALLAVGLFTALAYRRHSGEERRRIGWVMTGLVLSAFTYTIFNFVDILTLTTGTHAYDFVLVLTLAAQTTLPIALGYAVLRHRVLDVGFALNRTVIYGVMTALIVIFVSFVDWLTGRFLSEQRFATAVEAAVTIAFGVGLNWIHGKTERLVDRVIFRSRHLAEHRMELRIGALEFATTSALIDETIAVEAPRILDLHSAALFRRISANEPFLRMQQTEWSTDDTAELRDDSLLVTTLRSLERPLMLDDVAIANDGFPQGSAKPVLAIPIVSQHELIGIALFGNRPDGAHPDPEEVSLLARLCRVAGNAYAMVEARRWREHAAELERSLATMAPT